jgi:hypothetical protein
LGQDLSYQAGDDVYEYRISRSDWHLTQALREHLAAEVDLMFGVPALGDEVRVPSDALRLAADRVAAFVSENRGLLPYTYQFKVERPGDPNITPGFTTGGMSGIRLPNDADNRYWIRAGLNECRLKQIPINGSSRSLSWDEARDLRGERQLLTENLGLITIRRTRAKTDLLKALAEMQSFLKKITVLEVTKSIG